MIADDLSPDRVAASEEHEKRGESISIFSMAVCRATAAIAIAAARRQFRRWDPSLKANRGWLVVALSLCCSALFAL